MLDESLAAAPEVKVIWLDPNRYQIHLATGELREVNEPTDFIRMLPPPA